MACPEALKVQLWFDGESAGEDAHAVTAHIESCAECRALMSDLDQTRQALREPSLYRGADQYLRNRIAAALDAAAAAPRRAPWLRQPRAFWLGALDGALAMAAAAAVFVFFFFAPETDELAGDVTAAHIRSMVGTHLVDVTTDDPRAASTWLRAHAGLGFDAQAPKGFALVGARADYVYESSAAVAVYRGHGHVVDLFAWPQREDESLPQSASANGYNVVFWKRGNVVFCAVSNLPVAALEAFARPA